MKKYRVILFMILILTFCIINHSPNCKPNNQERFFLRISEKYDIQLKQKWEESILERENIVNKIKNSNNYDKYKEFTNELKKTPEFRLKTNYIRKLNYSIKNGNQEKTKRYLKLILNIFNQENIKIKEQFNID